MVGRGGVELGREVLRELLELAWELGLQRVIFERRQYDARTPAGTAYSGSHAHLDHLHIEQTRAAAHLLTRAAALALLLPQDEEVTVNVILMYSDVEGDTAAWLLVGRNRLYLHNWTNVQALIDAGAATVRLPRDVVGRLPEL